MADLGMFVGAIAITLFLTLAAWQVTKRWNKGAPGLWVANAISLAVAVLIAGYGFSQGSGPVFGFALFLYGPAQAVVLILTLIGNARSRAL